MTDQATAAAAPATGIGHYRASERKLWDTYGLAPSERFVELDRPRARLRILEVGSGPPVLLIHGTIGPGGWASLVGRLPGHRALVLDRPGWGMSDPVDLPRTGMRPLVGDLLASTLDKLGLERVDIVGGSIGNTWALSLAEHHPDRVGRVVLLGGGPLVDTVAVPSSIGRIASPIGWLIVRLKMDRARLESILRASGHGAGLAAGRIPDAFIEWRRSAHNDTAAMRHERALIRQVVRGSGWRAGITFDDAALGAIGAPVLLVYGTADPTGDVATWREFMAALPNGSLQIIDGAGHMPWFDDPARVASLVDRFLLPPPATDIEPLGAAYSWRSRSAGPT